MAIATCFLPFTKGNKLGKNEGGDMYRITKIEVQKKDDTRSSIFINGVFDFGITTKAVERYGLVQGMELTEEAYEELLMRIQLDKAKYRALEYLAGHNKTEKQVRDKLIRAEYSGIVIDEVIEFLKKYSYIDDDYFARRYIESKAVYGRKSARQIQSQLYLKGITSINPFDIWEELSEVEAQNVTYYLKKYKYEKELDYTQKRKIISRILNKGFSYEIIQKSIVNLDESFEV